MDNGFLLLNKVKIPHINMLAKYGYDLFYMMHISAYEHAQIFWRRSQD